MKTALLAFLFLVVTAMVEASPRRGGGGGRGGGRRREQWRAVQDALVEDGASVEWFIEDIDCATSDAEANEYTIEAPAEEEGGRGRGKGRVPPFLRDAREAACEDAELNDALCICQRVITASDFESDYVMTCGVCKEGKRGEVVSVRPDSDSERREDHEQVRDMMDGLEEELGIEEEDDSSEEVVSVRPDSDSERRED